jgi:hypothetical protein
MHLLMNALDAMPDGGQLTLRTRMEGQDKVQIDVEDTGVGMAKDILEKAMDPFFTTKPRGKGAGLGLPAVYGAVTAHQGTMEIHSEPGRGTQVQITLPVSPAEPKDVSHSGETEDKAGAFASCSSTTTTWCKPRFVHNFAGWATPWSSQTTARRPSTSCKAASNWIWCCSTSICRF